MVQIDFEYRSQFVPSNVRTNVVLATFTTAHARLRLFNVLHKLDENVLHFDTDSVIYKSKTGEPLVPTGDFLGDLTDELDGHHIVEFVSAGPKNYGYRVDNGLYFIKVKGFTLNHTVSKEINLEKMCKEVHLWCKDGRSTNTVVSYLNRIRRNPLIQTIFNRDETKRYRVVSTKRVLGNNYDTMSYRYTRSTIPSDKE